MPVSIDEARMFGDIQAVTLENENLRVTVLPELGAKIYGIVHKGTGADILWHNPRVSPRRVPFGSRFDDVWSGGWDEIFPNDAESVVGSERYPDMGEAWSLPWDYETQSRGDSASVTTMVKTPITPAKITRTLTLKDGETRFVCKYEFTNLSRNEISFLWKVHPAFAINDECRIEVPAAAGTVDPRYAHLYGQKSYRWPRVRSMGGGEVDISRVDPDRNDCSLHYLTGLGKGSARFVDRRHNLVSTISFDRRVMDNVWLFLAYGGWRGHYTAVIEPSTSYPYDLATAIRKGNCTALPGKGRMKASVEFSVDLLDRSRGEKRTKDTVKSRGRHR